MDIEFYKQIENSQFHYVSTHGNVLSIAKKREGEILKGCRKERGYHQVWLQLGEGYRWYYVHRLVALAFIPNPDNKPEINHKDDNPANNHVDNLEWSTHRENITHSYRENRRAGRSGRKPGFKTGKWTRKRMSKAKIGARHPKFKGYYVFNGQRYESAASAAAGTGQNARNLQRWAKSAKNGWNFMANP